MSRPAAGRLLPPARGPGGPPVGIPAAFLLVERLIFGELARAVLVPARGSLDLVLGHIGRDAILVDIELIPGDRALVLADSQKPAELDDGRMDPSVRTDQEVVHLADFVPVCA